MRLRSLLLGFFFALTPGQAEEGIPEKIDLSLSPAFPPVVRQRYQSCSQEAAIYYAASYAWNRQRNATAASLENRFSAAFSWQFLNDGSDRAAEISEAWQLAMAMGIPTLRDYPAEESLALGGWMNGYERYYQAMRHRVVDYEYHPIRTLEDIGELKQYLASPQGGVAVFEQRLQGSKLRVVGTSHALIEQWGLRGAGHAMAVVGYDDMIGMDFNGDGEQTNDRDVDGDGRVTLADWERGALLVVNSFGVEWGRGGKAYVPYRLQADGNFKRGQWYSTATVAPTYQPRLTLKVRFACADRSELTLWVENAAGQRYVPLLFRRQPIPAENPESPERYSAFIRGERRFGKVPPRGKGDYRALEMGFDLTGKLDGDSASFRMGIDFGATNGRVEQASLLSYDGEGTVLAEKALR